MIVTDACHGYSFQLPPRPTRPELRVDALVSELADMHDGLERMPRESLRQLLSMLISRLEIDLQTMEVEIDLRLPSWAISSTARIKNALSLDDRFARKTDVQAKQSASIAVAAYRCSTPNKAICFECQQLVRAA